jgi:translocation and assembly module TamB
MRTRKIIWQLLTFFLAAIVLLAATGFFIARSDAFQRFLLSRIIREAQDTTGSRIDIRRMKLSWSPLAADFYGLVMHGPEAGSHSPLLTANRLRVNLKVMALLKHHFDLAEIVIDHPTLNVRIDAHGNSNLPQAKTSQSLSSNFTIAIQHISIQNGTMNYNDQTIPLDAELRDFHMRANFDPLTAGYKGSLAYDHGWVLAENLNRFDHSAQIDFQVTRNRLIAKILLASAGSSRITVNATLTQFDHPQLEGDYDAEVETAELARVLNEPSLPIGDVRFSGVLIYRDTPNRSFLQTLEVSGHASSGNLRFHSGQLETRLTAVRSSYKITNGNLSVESLDANLLGGRADARGQISLAGSNGSQLQAFVRNASLQQISNVLPAGKRQNVALVGRADAQLHANWLKSLDDLLLGAHLTIEGPERTPPSGRDIPVNGVVDASYDAARHTVSFPASHLRTGKTDLTLNGMVSRNSSLNVTLDSSDLHELTTLLSSIESPSANAGYDLYGSAKFIGQISGSMTALHIHGDLSAASLQVQGSKWKTLRASIEASPSYAQVHDGFLQNDGPGQINFSGRTALQNWSFTTFSPLSVNATWKQLSAPDLIRLARADYPITGSLSGDVSIQGSLQHPSGHGSFNLAHASLWNQPVTSVSVDFQGDDDTIGTNTQITLPAGTAYAHLTYSPSAKHYKVDLNANNLHLDQLQALQRNAASSIKGVLTGKAQGEGTLAQPQLQATLDLPQLQVGDESFSQVHAQVDVAQQQAHITLTSAVAQASVQAKGEVTLAGNYPLQANLEVHGAPIAALLASYAHNIQAGLNGSMDLNGSINGPLRDPAQLQAGVQIPALKLGYKSLQINNEGPLRFDYRNSTVTVQQARLKGSGTDFSIQGAIPVTGQAPMNVSAKGVINASLLQLLSPDTHASGQIQLHLQAQGKTTAPAMTGQVRIVNAAFSSDAMPVGFSAINGQMNISGNRIEVQEIKGTAGGGSFSTHGSLTIGTVPAFALDLEAKSIRIHPNGIHSTLDGNLQLSGSAQKAQLAGRIVVDHLSFQQGSDLSTIIGQFSGAPTDSTPSAFATNTKLNIAVQSSDELSLANSQFSVAGSANLTVTNTLADPVILGRISLAGGEVFFLGKRFELQNGTVVFANPVETEPVLNLFVTTTVEQYNITINFLGPVDRLKTNYTSDPALPPLDIINLLAFGQTTAEQGSNAATPTSLGAESVVAQGVAGQVAKGVQSLTGISQLTLDPMGGTTANPGAQVAIQQRVTGNILFTFSTNVTTTQNQTVQVEYQPKRQVTISVIRDAYGGYGIDLKLHKVF